MLFRKILFLVFISLLCSGVGYAQVDVISKLNGEEMKGKVVKMGTDKVTFVYEGEELEYEVAKSDIHKIQFASGRTQVLNEMTAPASSSTSKAIPASERRGKIAVLPFDFATNDPSLEGESFETRAQIQSANSLRENTRGLEIQDPRQTNAILSQHNIAPDQLIALPPAQVAEMLGVEFVLYGTLKIDNKGTRSYGSAVTTYKDKKEDSRKDKDSKTKKDEGRAVTSTNTSTVTDFEIRIGINMYNDQGNSVYSDSREPFGTGTDAYTSAIDYMIKRTPYGSKHK